MLKVERARVDRLFGYVKLDIEFVSDSPITIISGPNGTGKTHFLRLLHALLSCDLRTLASVEYELLEVRLSDGHVVRLKQLGPPGDLKGFEFFHKQYPEKSFRKTSVPYSVESEDPHEVPPFLTQVADGQWYDARMERYLTAETAMRRYGIPLEPPAYSHFRGSWLEDFYRDSRSILIDTQRLDTPQLFSNRSMNQYRASVKQVPFSSRIRQYIEQVGSQLSEARQAALNVSLTADQTFAARVLQSKVEVNEEDLKARYQRIADQHAELHASGLSVSSVDVKFPEERANATERRFLNVFLDDWERKLQPLLPTHEKLNTLRRIVDAKFMGKELYLDTRRNIRFRSTYNGKPLTALSLSSGEQHLLAVFAMLLFAAGEGALVLIDEPEISMHAAWKHSFLEDISEVANLSKLQIILATHSSAIINGRWELVKEVQLPDIPPTQLLTAISDIDDGNGDDGDE